MRRHEGWLREMRARWAARPSDAPEVLDDPAACWMPPPPPWIFDTERLLPLIEAHDHVWRHGEVRWGWILMANNQLWERGSASAPGEVVWSPDPFVEAHPDWLADPCERFWWLKDPPQVGDDGRLDTDIPGWQRLRAFATDEHRSARRRRFPELLSCERVVYHDVVLIYREHLPGGALTSNMVPIVVAPGPTVSPTRLLPPWMWADELRQRWERAGEELAGKAED